MPDLSQPNRRPKPKPRAYIEQQQFKKQVEAAAKKSLDHVQAELPAPIEPVIRTTYRTEYPPTFHGVANAPYFPNRSRAPPITAS